MTTFRGFVANELNDKPERVLETGDSAPRSLPPPQAVNATMMTALTATAVMMPRVTRSSFIECCLVTEIIVEHTSRLSKLVTKNEIPTLFSGAEPANWEARSDSHGAPAERGA